MEKTNDFTYLRYDLERGEIYCKDLADRNNEPTFFNKTKRSLKKAIEAVEKAWSTTIRMREIKEIVNNCGVRTHYYCAMD